MTIRQASIICIIALGLILMSDVLNAKCTCCRKINDYCCETENRKQKDACCVTNGDISNTEDHDWSRLQCPEQNSTEVTPGLWEVCGTDKDCHEWNANANMVCVHDHRVVESKIVGKKIILSAFLKEAKPGKCQLAKTPGEKENCQTDEDCHKINPDMVCVRKYSTVNSKPTGGKLVVDYNVNEKKSGKCHVKELCLTDEDCHRINPDMVCVRKYSIVNSKPTGGKLVVNYNVKETVFGKCTLEDEMPNIVELAMATPELSTLVSAVGAAGLVDTLSSAGPFTVFAPNNDAFAKIPADKLADLLKPKNVEKLKAVLLRHVVPEWIKEGNIPSGTTNLETAGGEEIRVVRTKVVQVKSSAGQAKVIQTDIIGSNGIIHIVDSVF